MLNQYNTRGLPAYEIARNAVRTGWLTKQGTGTFKTWKKRWFILQPDTIYYFADPKDTNPKGVIILTPQSSCTETSLTPKNSVEEKRAWMFSVNEAIKNLRPKMPQDYTAPAPAPSSNPLVQGPPGSPGNVNYPTQIPNVPPTSTAPVTRVGRENSLTYPIPNRDELTARARLSLAKSSLPFLQEGKPSKFWQIWLQSVPNVEDLKGEKTPIEYYVKCTANLDQVSWRVCGPQKAFIQDMVDFFWNVGAPEGEIEKLNDMGFSVKPHKIGSWVEMSEQGGMDGGWFFPVEASLDTALKAVDAGSPVERIREWGAKNRVEKVYSLGRDMGATPPRQTELRILLPGEDTAARLNVALDAYQMFGFPAFPEDVISMIKSMNISEMGLSITATSEGFVRLGVLAPHPPLDSLRTLCELGGGRREKLESFETSMGGKTPAYIEYQILLPPYGYNVYKEGFNVVFHYHVGDEWAAPVGAPVSAPPQVTTSTT